MTNKIAILGTVGVPSRYGGFETLADNLVRYHSARNETSELTVWCSAKDNFDQPKQYGNAQLRYVNLHANGIQSVLYDIVSLFQAIRSGQDQIVLLGVSGAIALPIIRMLSNTRIITNIDGIEWKRDKWNRIAKRFLKLSEMLAVRFSHIVIADNEEIAKHVRLSYQCECEVIPYGGDHATEAEPDLTSADALPEQYALGLCRIEPENNVQMILEAFTNLDMPLVFVGNWENSDYGRELKARYKDHSSVNILDPIYDAGALRAVREKAALYVHGHSAGGTNPALVEMMHFGIPVLAFDCAFNRYTTESEAFYFSGSENLRGVIKDLTSERSKANASAMLQIARKRYTWSSVGKAYFELLAF